MRESALNDCCARRRERCTLIQEVLAHRHRPVVARRACQLSSTVSWNSSPAACAVPRFCQNTIKMLSSGPKLYLTLTCRALLLDSSSRREACARPTSRQHDQLHDRRRAR